MMESQSTIRSPSQIPVVLSTSVLFLILAATTMMIIIKTKNPRAKNKRGPWKLPVIGQMHHLAGGGGTKRPHRRLRDLAKIYGPVMQLQLGEINHVVISSAEAAEQVLKTQDLNFAQRPSNIATGIITYNGADLAQSPYGDFWRQLRKLCTLELLSARRVQSFRPIREEETWKLVREIASADGSTVNLSKLIFSLTYDITSRIAFGNICKDRDEYIPVAEEIMEAAAGFTLADFFPSVKWLQTLSGLKSQMKRLHRAQDNLLEKIIHDHRMRKSSSLGGEDQDEESSEDLVDALLNLQRSNNVGNHLGFTLTNENIKAVIGDMFIAGSDTSSTTVEWAMSELLKNPTEMNKAQKEVRQAFSGKGKVDEAKLSELTYLKLVIKETLRLHPPAPLLTRECREECEVGDHHLPLETRVLINAWAIARDPTIWDNPDEFRPERFLVGTIDYKGTSFEYLPFGGGRRMCPGIVFGTVNVELPLANLLLYFDWELASGVKSETLDTDESFGLTVKRQNDLKLIPTLRYPVPVVA